MSPSSFVEAFHSARASAIVRTTSAEAARRAMQAAVKGGFTVCEFTLTTPGAYDLISEFSKMPGLIVGAGTVLTALDARAAVQAGAKFLVSPVIDEVVIAEAAKLNVAMMPGCATPTEMLKAHRAGAQLQKLFPSLPANHGPTWVAQALAPLPMLKIVPTSGVTVENAAAFLKAGAWAVGFVAALFDAADIAAGRFDAIEARARAAMQAVAAS